MKNNKGYPFVHLLRNGIAITYKIHILVYETFGNRPINDYTIHHIDSNKMNNYIGNLELKSFYENSMEYYKDNVSNRKSGLPLGVYRSKNGKRYTSNICHNN